MDLGGVGRRRGPAPGKREQVGAAAYRSRPPETRLDLEARIQSSLNKNPELQLPRNSRRVRSMNFIHVPVGAR